MSRILLLVAAIAALCLSGCMLPDVMISGIGEAVTGSGNLVTLEQPNRDFNRLEFSHAFQAEVTQGETFSVVITIDDNLEQYLDVSQIGDTLRIGLEPDLLLSLRNSTMRARVTMPELRGLNGSGASQIEVTGFESEEDLDVQVSGASRLRGNIEVGDVRFDVSGASQLNLSGRGQDGRVTVSGASQLDLSDFPLRNVDAEASGASRAEVYASGQLDAEASGASTVLYSGDPTLGRIQTSGASNVRPR